MKFFAYWSLVFLSFAAHAQESTGPWKSDAELGVLITQGNTETQSYNLKARASYDRTKWRASGDAEAIYKEENSVESANRYLIKGKYDYKIIPDLNYVFVLAQYEDDKFSGYDYRVTEAVGYGHSLIKQPTLTLDAELGAGARQSEPETGDSENEAIVRIAGILEYKFSETASFREEGTIEGLIDSTTMKSVTSIKAQLNSKLFLKASFTARYVDTVPAGIEKDDYETSVTLGYTIF